MNFQEEMRIVRAVEVTPLPGEAIALGGATQVLPADKIAAALVALVNHNNGISRS